MFTNKRSNMYKNLVISMTRKLDSTSIIHHKYVIYMLCWDVKPEQCIQSTKR